jgi:hypothetical protein
MPTVCWKTPIELEVKDTTDTDASASYLDLHLEIDNEGRLKTKAYDKRDDFNFPLVNFPFICSNIPAAPAYVYIPQLIRYSRACGSYVNEKRITVCNHMYANCLLKNTSTKDNKYVVNQSGFFTK